MYKPEGQYTLRQITIMELMALVADREAKLANTPIENHNGNVTESIIRELYTDPSNFAKILRGDKYYSVTLSPEPKDDELTLPRYIADKFITRPGCYENIFNLMDQ